MNRLQITDIAKFKNLTSIHCEYKYQFFQVYVY